MAISARSNATWKPLTLGEILPELQLTLDGLHAEFDYSLSDRFIHFALVGTANGSATVHIPVDPAASRALWLRSLPFKVPLGWLEGEHGVGVTVGVRFSAARSTCT